MATEVKIGVKAASAVDLPNSDHVNLFVDAADDKVKVKDSTGTLTSLGGGGGEPAEPQLTDDIVAALEGSATSLSALNPVVSVADLPAAVDLGPAADITDAMVAGLAGSTTPVSASNPVVSVADLPAPVDLGPAGDITADQVAALAGSVTALSGTNVVVSTAELAAALAPAAFAVDLGSVNPTQGTGYAAPKLKFGIQRTGTCVRLWVKTGAENKAWSLIGP